MISEKFVLILALSMCFRNSFPASLFQAEKFIAFSILTSFYNVKLFHLFLDLRLRIEQIS